MASTSKHEITLGNTAVLEVFRDPDDNDSLKKRSRPDLHNRTTTMTFPEDWKLIEKVTAVKEMWDWQSDADGPEWVDGKDTILVHAIAELFTTDDHTCHVGKPDNWNEG